MSIVNGQHQVYLHEEIRICCDTSYLLRNNGILQGPTLSIAEVYQSVINVIETLDPVWMSIDEKYHEWYQKAVSTAATVGVEPRKARTIGTQVDRENMLADNIEDY